MEFIRVFYEKYSKYFSHAKNKALLAEEKQKKPLKEKTMKARMHSSGMHTNHCSGRH